MYAFMMGAWVNRFCLVLLLGLGLSGCANLPQKKFDGELTNFEDVFENPKKYHWQDVTLYGFVTFDQDWMSLWTLNGPSDYRIHLSWGKINWGDTGLESRKVVLRGRIKWIDCEAPGATYNYCGTFLDVENILWID